LLFNHPPQQQPPIIGLIVALGSFTMRELKVAKALVPPEAL
jgi:hypothetical protein